MEWALEALGSKRCHGDCPFAVVLRHHLYELLELHTLHAIRLPLLAGLSGNNHVAVLVYVKRCKHPFIFWNNPGNSPCTLIRLCIGAVSVLIDAEHLVESVDRGYL